MVGTKPAHYEITSDQAAWVTCIKLPTQSKIGVYQNPRKSRLANYPQGAAVAAVQSAALQDTLKLN